jgi:phosphoribosyl-ATP pyrophosphohydrolase
MTKPPKRAGKTEKKAAPKKRAAKATATLPKKATPLPGPTDVPAPAKKRAVKKAGVKKTGVKKAGVTKAAVRQSRGAAARVADLSRANAGVLDRLFEVVTERRNADPNISHSARLLSRGTAKVAQKFGEEAVECLIEAVSGNSAKLIGESADVLYHLIVLWVDAGLHPGEVWSELQRREGTSGIAEKASRPASSYQGD